MRLRELEFFRHIQAPPASPTSCAPPNRSRGGKAFIVLRSTAKNDTISRIVPTLAPGTLVSTSKNDIDYVVTEYGVAQLRGKSAGKRAREQIGIAHPDFSGELMEQARRMSILRGLSRPGGKEAMRQDAVMSVSGVVGAIK